MDTRKAVWLALGWLTVACSGNKAPTEPEVQYKLAVNVGEGASGTPRTGVYMHPAGASVPYSFSASDGYRNLVVEQSSTMLPNAGSVNMTADREIFVSAEAIPILPPEAEPVKSGMVSFMSAPNAEAVRTRYEEYLANLDALYQTRPEQARDLALSAHSSAFAEATEAQITAFESALSGRVFGRSVTQAVRYMLGAERRSAAMIFVNGIHTSQDAAAISLHEIRRVVDNAGLTLQVETYNFYNASARRGRSEQDRCLLSAFSLYSFALMRNCGDFLLGDLLEAKRQMAGLINYLPAESPEALALAQIIEEERASGRAVLLIGHSQGSLIAAEALKKLAAPDECIAAISLGAPLGKSSWSPQIAEGNLDGFVVAGDRVQDIILALGHNDFPRLATDISRAADERARTFDNQNLSVAHLAADQIHEDLKLHNMVRSYLAGVESRAKIGELIARQSRSLLDNPNCLASTGAYIYASSGQIKGTFDDETAGPSDLWRVSISSTGADVLVGRIRTNAGLELLVTDIAKSSSGELYAVTRDALYKLDTVSALATRIIGFTSELPPNFNALAIDGRDRVYIASKEGRMVALELPSLNVFWQGDLGSLYQSSGDLTFSPQGDFYAIVLTNIGFDRLAKLDLESGAVTKLFEPSGCRKVWGITFVGNVLYGVTGGRSTGRGSLVSIDTPTGECKFIRELGFNAFGASLRGH